MQSNVFLPRFTGFFLILLAILNMQLGGCSLLFGPDTLKAADDKDAVHRQLESGPNTLIGRTMVMEARKQDYKPVTCHGSEVYLMPITARSKEWAELVCGKGAGDPVEPRGRTFFAEEGYRVEVKGVASLLRETRRQRCNIFGEFRFDAVANGDFYLFTELAFTVRRDVFPDQSPRTVMAKVHLEGGKVTVVELWKDVDDDDAPLFLFYPFASTDPDAVFNVVDHHLTVTGAPAMGIFGDHSNDFINLFGGRKDLNPLFGNKRIVTLFGLGCFSPEPLAINDTHARKVGDFQQHLRQAG